MECDSIEDFLDFGYFHLAKSVSKLSNHHRARVGAVVVKKKPVSAASNKVTSHPKYANPSNSIRTSIHAEIRALMNCECDVRGGEVWVFRQHRDGKPAMAKPCKYCESVIRDSGIKTVYYTIEEYPYWERMRL